MAKLLIVEDNKANATMVAEWLSDQHFTVELSTDGLDAMERLLIGDYDLVLLDWELPGMAGYEVCRKYRSQGGLTPIIMVTGRNSEADKVAGLDIGADDYVTKPFNLLELTARIRARLRSTAGATSNQLSANGLTLDPVSHKVSRNGQVIELLPKEFALLEFFMRNPDTLFASEAIINRVWVTESDATDNALRATVKRLRPKIDLDDDSMIETVYGMGYRFRTKK